MQQRDLRAGAISPHARDKFLPPVQDPNARRAALCLCGNGYRAAVFQLGTIRRLNEFGGLSRVETISCTGGGAIVGGALALHWHALRADTRGRFVNLDELVVEPVERFCSHRIRLGLLFWNRFRPSRWEKIRRYEHNQADLLADYLDRRLLRGLPLREMPEHPTITFVATNLRTGQPWEFRRHGAGELLLGYAPPHRLRTSEAVAAAMLDPVHMPALVVRLDPDRFEGGALGPKADPLREFALLSSGSAVDPLAVEPVWRTHGNLIVCDGGRRPQVLMQLRDGHGRRMNRILEVAGDHAHETAKRWLIGAYASGNRGGAYIGLGAYHGHYGLPGSIGFPADLVEEIRQLSDAPSKLDRESIMLLENHGYTLADTALRRYSPEELPADAPLTLPFPDFVDRTRILASLSAKSSRLRPKRAA